MASPVTITDVSAFTSPVTSIGTGEDADQAEFLAAIQILANRTRYNFDQIGTISTTALAASQVLGRASTGITEGKSATDFAFTLLALGTAVGWADVLHTKGANVASAATTNIAGATGVFVHITGTTTITAFGTATAGVLRLVRFAGALTLTHNATSLILPTGASLTTAADDMAIVVSEGSGNWRVVGYHRASGNPVQLSPTLTGLTVAHPTAPVIGVSEADGPVNEKEWEWIADGGALVLRTRTDAGGVGTDVVSISRVGTVPFNLTIDVSNAVILTGDLNLGANQLFAATDVRFDVTAIAPKLEQDVAADATGEPLTVEAQGNNSATLKAGNLVLKPGTNVGAGADGDLELGLGTAQIEVDGAKIGFFTATPVVKPTVSGARNTQAAVADALAELATLGLITDSSTLQTAPQVIAPAATTPLDFATNRLNKTTLDQNTTFSIVAPPNVGDLLEVIIVQDGTGTRTGAWPAGVKWAGGTAPTLTTAAAAEDHVYLTWEGGTAYTGRSVLNVS